MNFDKIIKTLEFDQILDKIEKYAVSDEVKDYIKNIVFYNDVNTISQQLHEKDEAIRFINQVSNLICEPNYDIYPVLLSLGKGRILTIHELYSLTNFFRTVNKFKKQGQLGIKICNLQYLRKYFLGLTFFDEKLDYVLQIVNKDLEILDTASHTLKKIRDKIYHYESLIFEKMEKLKKQYKEYLADEIISYKNNTYCLVVNQSYKKKVKGLQVAQSSSGVSVYIEPIEIQAIKNNIASLKSEEDLEIQIILLNASKYFSADLQEYFENLKIVKMLDYIFACGQYLNKIDAYLPNINNEFNTSIINARHPLIEEPTPISFSFTKEKPITLITGPNTGGKTAALKTIGLFLLMVKAGLTIPCDKNSNIAIFENIYADIGDQQSLIQSLSTFSGHLKNIINILSNANSNDLVLLDELGSGTDPMEGEALAQSIIEDLKNKKITSIITTHYSKLKKYAYTDDFINLCSVSFDKDNLKPLYEIQMGISGSSHALLIAKRLGLFQYIIDNAYNIIENKNQKDISILDKLNEEKENVEKLKKEYDTKLSNLNNEILKYEKRIIDMDIQKDKEIEKINTLNQKKWDMQIKILEDVISELKIKETITRDDLKKLTKNLNTPDIENIIEYEFQLNDNVYIPKYQQIGKIVKIKKNKYSVDLGMFELDFTKDEIRLTHQKVSNPKVNTLKSETIQPKNNISTDLDLRGKRYVEVFELIDRAIDDILLSNLSELRIIHGYGTGAVKKAVLEYIQKSSIIKSHRSGGEKEGMLGVTIIKV